MWLQGIRVWVERGETGCLLCRIRVRVEWGETHRQIGVTPLLVGIVGIGGMLGKRRGLVGRKLLLGWVQLLMNGQRVLDVSC